MAASLKVFDGPPEDFDKYDICLEFPVDSSTNKLKAVGSEVLDRMISIFGSKYVFLFYSDDTSKIYALIRAALKLVKIKAETDGYKLLLDADVAKERAFDGDEEARVDGFSIPHVEEVSKIEPFEYIYGEYVSDINVQDLYHKAEGSTHPFPKLVRIKLMSRMLRTTKALTKDCELSLDYLQLGSVIHDYYPVHDRDQLDTLRGDWLSVCFVPWRQPFLDIKDYFGEKMGFYFLFLGTPRCSCLLMIQPMCIAHCTYPDLST
jgi:anoctamin-10/anoctamin-7